MAKPGSKYCNYCKKKGMTILSLCVMGEKVSRKMEKPKRFNWFHKELGYMRPGSIEILGFL